MLCAKYDYKADIAVKQKEAFEDGKNAGIKQGVQQKAVEDAKNFYANGVSVEIIAKALQMSVEDVMKIINQCE